MNVEAILLWPSTQAAELICKLLLLIDRQVLLRSSEEAYTTLRNDNSEVANLLVGIFCVEYVLDLCIFIFSPNDRGVFGVFEVVKRARVFERLVLESALRVCCNHLVNVVILYARTWMGPYLASILYINQSDVSVRSNWWGGSWRKDGVGPGIVNECFAVGIHRSLLVQSFDRVAKSPS